MCRAAMDCEIDPVLIVPAYSGCGSTEGPDLWRYYGVDKRFPIYYVPFPKLIGRLLFPVGAIVIAFILRADCVWSRHLSSSFLSVFLRKPVITEFHAVPDTRPTRAFLDFISSSPLHLKSVFITKGLLQAFMKRYPEFSATKGITIAPDGYAPELFENIPGQSEARAKLSLSNENRIIGYAGHLYPGKGIDLLLEIARECREFLFLLVGGEEEDIHRVRDQVLSYQLENVRLEGFISPSRIPLFLSACDYLILPNSNISPEGGENFTQWTSPLKLFEYLAAGKPILASDLPVFREILDKETAMLCDPNSISAWVEAINTLETNPHICLDMRRKAKLLSNQLTWQFRIARVLDGIDIVKDPSDG